MEWTGTANVLRWNRSFFLDRPGSFCRQKVQEAGCLVPDYHSSTSLSAFKCWKSAAPQIIIAVHEDGLKCEFSRLSRGGTREPRKQAGPSVKEWEPASGPGRISAPGSFASQLAELSQVIPLSPECNPQLYSK